MRISVWGFAQPPEPRPADPPAPAWALNRRLAPVTSQCGAGGGDEFVADGVAFGGPGEGERAHEHRQASQRASPAFGCSVVVEGLTRLLRYVLNPGSWPHQWARTGSARKPGPVMSRQIRLGQRP